jgi:hypothetical protein
MRFVAGVLSVALFCCGLFVFAQAQQGQPVGPYPPCPAFGTTTGTCLQGAGDLGTPSAGVGTNLTGTASGLTAGAVTGLSLTAWSTFSPTITCGTGAVGAYSIQIGRYKVLGKTVWFTTVVQAAIGTCSGTITIGTLPVAALTLSNVFYAFSGQDGASGAGLDTALGSNATTFRVFLAALGNPTGSDLLIISGTYESN